LFLDDLGEEIENFGGNQDTAFSREKVRLIPSIIKTEGQQMDYTVKK